MTLIKTIDLWTEQHDNHCECFNGAFVDGFENNKIAFDKYKIVKNCNCIITVEPKDIPINNKHNAIVFYKNEVPVRLMVVNKNTDVDKCINVALNQYFEDSVLEDVYKKLSIKSSVINMAETPANNIAPPPKKSTLALATDGIFYTICFKACIRKRTMRTEISRAINTISYQTYLSNTT